MKLLLLSVRQDLDDDVAITSSGKKQTNHHRALIAMLTKGMIPNSWMRYKVPTSCSMAAWVTDFSSRVKQLSDLSKVVRCVSASQLKSITVWMRGKTDCLVLHRVELVQPVRPVQPGGLHHGHQAVCAPGKLLVTGGTTPGCLRG